MKMVREPARVVASVFSLCAFVVAVVAGWRAGASSLDILVSATVSMVVAHLVGLWAGWAGERSLREFFEQYRAKNPVQDVKGAGRALNQSGAGRPAQPVESVVNKRAA